MKRTRNSTGACALGEVAAKAEADQLISATSPDGAGTRVIARVFDNRDAESLKHLALALIAHSQAIALLGSRDKDTARVVFAKSMDAVGDMNALMREACVMLDGRGGGKPDLAQGGGHNVEKLQEAIDRCADFFGKMINAQIHMGSAVTEDIH